MSAPSAAAILSGIDSRLGSPFQSPRPAGLTSFLTDLSSAINSAWAAWEAGITGGGNTVNGSGLGTWSGTGMDGTLTEGTPMTPTVSTYSTPEFQEYANAVKTVLQNKFNLWVTTFVFTLVAYAGTSTATPISPGSFDAQNTPAAIGTLGNGTNPSGIKADIETLLTSFDLGNSAVPVLNQAIEDTIIEEFTNWLASAQFSGDTVSGDAAAGDGSGSGTSDGNGTIS